MSASGFWSDQLRARHLIAELKSLRSVTEPHDALRSALAYDLELSGLAEEPADAAVLLEVEGRLAAHRTAIAKLENTAFFRGKADARDALLSIQAGAGGVDAMDWAERLERMYLRWLAKSGFEAEIVDRMEGGEAGIHRSVIEVRGAYAFGHLKGETGVHRVCHISEFDAERKKQTSFAAVEAMPVLPEVAVEIRDADLEVDTFCSGGPGGQNVNKVASAVRIRHLPTGITVKCQSQRSQFQNRTTALEILASKIRRLEEEKLEPKGTRTDASFGHQIRTYVLQPYQLVKDHRTDHRSGDAMGVLDGDLGGFVEAYLRRA